MPDLTTLEPILSAAEQSLASNPFQALLLPHRRAIWAALGLKQLDRAERASGPGLVRRINLEILAVEKVLPHWRITFPGEHGPLQMIALAKGVLAGTFQENEVSSESDDFEAHARTLGVERGEPIASLVGQAAARLPIIALYDLNFGEDGSASDQDLDPEMWEPSYFCSIVAANGPFNAQGSSNEARGDFWRWYIREAVPIALHSAS